MTDRPIIFSAPMVRALLGGRKTMTRRLAWQDRKSRREDNLVERHPSPWQKVAPGDRLWVRESFCNSPVQWHSGSSSLVYAADFDVKASRELMARHGVKWTPSIHMPRSASRITLVVTATRIERLRDISAADAEAEGVFRHVAEYSLNKVFRSERGATAIRYFRELWESLHGPGSWSANPEVVALTFAVHKGALGLFDVPDHLLPPEAR